MSREEKTYDKQDAIDLLKDSWIKIQAAVSSTKTLSDTYIKQFKAAQSGKEMLEIAEALRDALESSDYILKVFNGNFRNEVHIPDLVWSVLDWNLNSSNDISFWGVGDTIYKEIYDYCESTTEDEAEESLDFWKEEFIDQLRDMPKYLSYLVQFFRKTILPVIN